MIETGSVYPDTKRHPFRWLVVCCFIASLLLIWIPKFLPLVDYPEHLLAIQVLAHPNDLAFHYARDYAVEFHHIPYLTAYILGMLLNRILPIFWTGKILLSFYLVLTPLSVFAYLKSLRLEVWPGLLSFAFLFNLFFYMGSLNFLLSIPLAFFTLAGTIRWLTEPDGLADTTGFRKTKWIHPLCIMGGFLLLFYTHFVTFAAVILVAVAMLLFRSITGVRIFQLGVATVPSLLLAMLTLWQEHLRSPGGLSMSWLPLPSRLFDLLQPFLIYRDDSYHVTVINRLNIPLLVLALVLIGVSLIGEVRDASSRPKGNIEHSRKGLSITWIVFTAFLASALIFPSELPSASFAHRLSILVLFSSIAVLPTKMARSLPVKVVMVSAALFSFTITSVRMAAFSREMRPLNVAIQRMNPGSRVLPLIQNPHSRHLQGYPFLHSINYYHLIKGGSNPNLLFRNMPQMPVRYRFLSEMAPLDEFNPSLFRWEIHHDDYRYFLARQPTPEVFADLSAHTHLIFESEGWYLFERSLE